MIFGNLRASVAEFAERAFSPRPLKQRFIDLVSSADQFTPPPANARTLIKLHSTQPWVRTILSKVADGCADQAWYLERKSDGERVDEHPALAFIRSGNRRLRGRASLRATVAYRDLSGEAFWIIGRAGANNTGAAVNYAVIPSDWVTDIPDTSDGKGFYTVRTPGHGLEYKIAEADMIWFRDPDLLDPYARGSGVVASALIELTTDTAAANFLAGYFKNSARPDLIVSGTKESPIRDQDKGKLETYWNARHKGAGRNGRPFFSAQPLAVQELGKGLRDNEMSNVRASLKAAISEIFGVPPEIFGRIENSNRSTIDAAAVLFGRYTLHPRLKAICEELAPFIEDNFDVAGYTLKFESPIPDDMDFALRAAGSRPGAFTDDEVRTWAKLRPLGGKHAKPIDPPDMTPANDDGKDGGDPPGKKKPKPKADDEDETKAFAPVTRSLSPDDVVRVASAHEDPNVTAEATRIIEDIFKALLAKYGGEFLEALESEVRFQVNASVAEWVLREAPALLGHVDKTTRDALRASLVEGAALNESVEALAKRIDDLFAAAAETRAVLIGQTAATSLTGFGTLEASRQAGFERKKWLTSQDQVVRDSHRAMNGQVRRLDEPFASPKGGQAMHPGAFREAGEDINCRCAMRPVLEGERALSSDADYLAFADTQQRRIGEAVAAKQALIFIAQAEVAKAALRRAFIGVR